VIGNGHAGFGRAASEKDPQRHLAGVVPRQAAIPARSLPNGREHGFAKRCARGEHATAPPRPRTTGRAPTHAGAAAKRSKKIRSRRMPRAVHCHRSVRELGGGVRRRLRRRVNVWGSAPADHTHARTRMPARERGRRSRRERCCDQRAPVRVVGPSSVAAFPSSSVRVSRPRRS